MILAHRIELDPTVKQREYFARAAGCARFVWNWALAEWNAQYEMGGKPKAKELKRYFNAAPSIGKHFIQNIRGVKTSQRIS